MVQKENKLAQALEGYARWIEAHGRFIIGLILWAAIMLIVFFVGTMQLSDRIQAASMITLVFITLFYAVQTQALVKEQNRNTVEEKRRRDAGFGEKRIHTFISPLGNMLRRYQDSLNFLALSDVELKSRDFPAFIANMRKDVEKIEEFFTANMYMANDSYGGKILPLMRDIRLGCWTIESWEQDKRAEWLTEKDRELESIIGMLEVETHHISRQIQDAYGDYAQKQIL